MAGLLETFSTTLQPYKELAAATAGILTICSFFSGAFVCLNMKKKGYSDLFPMMPFLGGIFMSVINFKYGLLIQDYTVITVTVAGFTLNTIYILCYFYYAKNKGDVWYKVGITGALSAAVLAYAAIENPDVVKQRLGLLLTALFFGLIGAPLFNLPNVIRKKSTEGLPFPMIVSGGVMGTSWLLYGLIIRDTFMIFQNCVGLSMALLQLSLFVIYPSQPKKLHPESRKNK